MKIKNISLRTYQHGIYTIQSGAEISVPDNIGALLLRTKEFILLEEKGEEPKKEIKEETKVSGYVIDIEELGPKPDISKIKLESKKEVKKSVNTGKGKRRRV